MTLTDPPRPQRPRDAHSISLTEQADLAPPATELPFYPPNDESWERLLAEVRRALESSPSPRSPS